MCVCVCVCVCVVCSPWEGFQSAWESWGGVGRLCPEEPVSASEKQQQQLHGGCQGWMGAGASDQEDRQHEQ